MPPHDEARLQLRLSMRTALEAFVATPTEERVHALLELLVAYRELHLQQLDGDEGREQLELPLAG